MSNFLPFALPDIGEEEISEVVDALRSSWITTGPKAKRFESDFKGYLNNDDVEALAVNSATSGLHLALEAVGIKAGDEVIVPTFTFTATAEVVRYLGAHPVFVDIDLKTYNIDIKSLEASITEKTKAIIPVHFAGLACDMDKIIALARRYDLKVIEDAAHAFPSKYNSNLIGSLDTDATVFSFYANKTMTTGEGGMLVSKNKDIIERCKIMRLHGISRDAFDRYQSKIPAWYYEVIEPGFKYNMPDICAALGIEQLKKINLFHEKRVKMASYYNEVLKDLPILLPPIPKNISDHAWHLYTIRLNDDVSIRRDEFIVKMAEKQIGCSVHFIPLHKQPIWKNTYQLKSENYPKAEWLYKNIVSIPLYTKMTFDDQKKVVAAIHSLLG